MDAKCLTLVSQKQLEKMEMFVLNIVQDLVFLTNNIVLEHLIKTDVKWKNLVYRMNMTHLDKYALTFAQ